MKYNLLIHHLLLLPCCRLKIEYYEWSLFIDCQFNFFDEANFDEPNQLFSLSISRTGKKEITILMESHVR